MRRRPRLDSHWRRKQLTSLKRSVIIYETLNTPASLFFAKTPVHSAEHEGSYRIFADIIFADAVQYCENCESFRAYGKLS